MAEPTIAIVGAGPQALAVVLALVDRDPDRLDRLAVYDPSGRWLTAWRRRFQQHRIDRLRSAGVHHPHPDPMRLRAHAVACDRLGEFHAPYDMPDAVLFDHFCDRLLADGRLDDLVVSAEVVALAPDHRGAALVLGDGSRRWADRVVIATNPTRRRLPPETELATVAWRHSDDVDLDAEVGLAGRRVDVVGGGLTAVQLATGAAADGATVCLWSRRPLVERQFDVHPGWLGPRELDGFRRCNHRLRRRRIDQARGGGSVPAEDLEQLAVSGVRHAVAPDAAAQALSGDADEVWLATGHQLDVVTDPLLAGLRAYSEATVHDGLPVLDTHLAWPGTTVHLMGGYAALALGPASRNLWGARHGAERIVAAAS